MGTPPLSLRLTLGTAFATFALVLGTTGYLYMALAKHLRQRAAQVLADKVYALELLAAENGKEQQQELRRRVEDEWPGRPFEKLAVRVLGIDGDSIVQTPSLAPEVISLLDDLLRSPLDSQSEGVVTDKGRHFRYRETTTRRSDGAAIIIQILLDDSDDETLLDGYRTRSLAVILLSLVVGSLVAWRISVRGLRPLDRMTEAAGRIRFSTLHERIDTANMPEEVARLAATFNKMLDRLEDTFTRLSRFSADIAHELRTPIGNLVGGIEVTLQRERTSEEYQERLVSSLEEARRLLRIFESLLFLARAENPLTQLQKVTVRLDAELATIAGFFEAAASEKRVTLSIDVPERIEVQVERGLFQQAMANLVENSLKHTDPGGLVSLTAESRDGFVFVRVRDTGVGVAREQLPLLFERFYRTDASRARRTGGTGLGLSIVKSIAAIHGGGVSIESALGQGTMVEFVLPSPLAAPESVRTTGRVA